MLDFLQSRRIRLLWTALIHIGASASPVSGKYLAQKLDCPRRYLESDLQALSQHGLLESRRGAHGGYVLARSPQRISLYDVLSCLNEETPPDHDCSCPVQRQIVLPQIMQAQESLTTTLNAICLADALQQASQAHLMQLPVSTPDFSI
jgi:Rrf2 family protein